MSAVVKGLFRLLGQVLLTTFSVVLVIVLLVTFAVGLGIGIGGGMRAERLADSPAQGASRRYSHVRGDPESPSRLLYVPVHGPILGMGGDPYSLWMEPGGITWGYQVQELFDQAAESDDIRGVLLHVRSPGGTIFGSRAILDGITRYRDATGRPVLAWVEGIAASGAVMAMAGADSIYADHGSLVGSIGVLGPALLYYDQPVAIDGGIMGGGVATERGIEQVVVSAGWGKDLGNPFRRPTAREIETLQRGVDNEYRNFVQVLGRMRGIEPARIRAEFGAQMFDNATAEAHGLIDGTLSFPDALHQLATLAGAGEDYQLVEPVGTPRGLLSRLLHTLGGGEEPHRRPAQRHPLCDAAAARLPLAWYGELRAICGPMP